MQNILYFNTIFQYVELILQLKGGKIIEKKISPNQVLDNWSVAGQIRIKQYRFLGIGNSHSECYLQN